MVGVNGVSRIERHHRSGSFCRCGVRYNSRLLSADLAGGVPIVLSSGIQGSLLEREARFRAWRDAASMSMRGGCLIGLGPATRRTASRRA